MNRESHKLQNKTLLATLEPLMKYMARPEVFELRVNKFGQVVLDTTKGREFIDDAAITQHYIYNQVISTLCHANAVRPRAVNDFNLPDGSRAIICQPPAVLEGTCALAFRKHLNIVKTLEELRAEGRFNKTKVSNYQQALTLEPFEEELLALHAAERWPEFFRMAVRTRRNIAVAGGTGSGKTTFTKSLLLEMPIEERTILLQDIAEVIPNHLRELVLLQYGEGGDRPTSTQCLKACMRLTPKRIIMTELRDEAAWDLLASANTAHPGTIFSTHADDAQSTPARVADLVKGSKVGGHLDYDMILKRVMTTLDVTVHMENWNITQVLYDPMHKKRMLQGLV